MLPTIIPKIYTRRNISWVEFVVSSNFLTFLPSIIQMESILFFFKEILVDMYLFEHLRRTHAFVHNVHATLFLRRYVSFDEKCSGWKKISLKFHIVILFSIKTKNYLLYYRESFPFIIWLLNALIFQKKYWEMKMILNVSGTVQDGHLQNL